MKYLVVVLSCFAILGCARSSSFDNVVWKKHYYHNKYGLLSTNHNAYKSVVKECTQKVFSGGMEIEGKYISDGHVIIEMYRDHKFQYAKKKSKELNRVPTEKEAMDIAFEYAENMPDFISVVHKNKNRFEKCFSDQTGFNGRYKTIPYDKVTGNQLVYNKHAHRFYVVERKNVTNKSK